MTTDLLPLLTPRLLLHCVLGRVGWKLAMPMPMPLAMHRTLAVSLALPRVHMCVLHGWHVGLLAWHVVHEGSIPSWSLHGHVMALTATTSTTTAVTHECPLQPCMATSVHATHPRI